MVYRRKSPSAAQLNSFRQLQQLCNVTALGLSFQAHDAEILLEQLKLNNAVAYARFEKNTTRQDFFPSRVVKGPAVGRGGGALITDAPAFTLPLPKYLIDPSESPDDLVQRVFYHSSMVKHATEHDEESYTPRCGLTGLFFSREEVVDNLQAAAAELGFKSPFWIRTDNPALGDFLLLKEGSEAICLSLSAAITSIENLQPFDESLLHPKLRRAVGSKGLVFGADIPPGMNAFSGFVTKNPFVRGLPNRGVWLSQDQVLQNNLQLKEKGNTTGNSFVLVEVEQWEMHNADQLSVPGRLALRRPEARNAECSSVFV